MSRSVAVKVLNLFKRYGKLEAVRGVSFDIYGGECFGILGPNGAGKTSIIKMMFGLSPITSGDIYIFGLDVKRMRREVNRRIGVVPQEKSLDTVLSTLDNLLVYASYFGIPKREARKRADRLMEIFDLQGKADTKIEELSGGMQRKLTVARALINDPELLILDEPTTGLDPESRHLIWDRVKSFKEEGKTVILTTHYMDEAEVLCDRIALMDKGKIIIIDKPKTIVKRMVGNTVFEIEFTSGDKVLSFLNRINGKVIYRNDRVLKIADIDESAVSDDLLKNIVYIKKRQANLEDTFMVLTGKGIR